VDLNVVMAYLLCACVQMPLCCDAQTMTVILIVLLLYALSPVDIVAEKTHGRRHVDELFLLFVLALGITMILDCGRCYYRRISTDRKSVISVTLIIAPMLLIKLSSMQYRTE